MSPEEVKAANNAIDAHQGELKGRTHPELRNTKDGTPLAGDGTTPRLDMGGMLGWERPHSDVFRRLLAHPRLVPYLTELLGEGCAQQPAYRAAPFHAAAHPAHARPSLV